MRRLLCLPILALLLGSALAADEPKANTLTPKEISDGWLLLFDGETTFGWKIDGETQAKDGTLIIGGDKGKAVAEFGSSFGSFELQFQYQQEFNDATKKDRATVNLTRLFTASDLLTTTKPRWNQVTVRVNPFGSKTTIQNSADRPPMTVEKTFKNPTLDQPAVIFTTPAGGQLFVRNVRLKPLDLKPIFNGKDLTGWKEHPGKKSVFTVEDGTIHIKNGPGDLQTEGQWADFVLQLECISNGKHLNSGVFFRCRPGEYQQGYEAQIHNGFGEQPKEYTLEDYDPQTHKLLGTRKEKYTALDYGTGAIYRRQPARKQMSKDNEWFGMTVVAQGRHMAVWVNGVQVTDWTDNRPLADNARKGCMLDKGNISLQGHDPTTDLSFRNFRIAELAAEKPKAKD